jgi:hypothetical protein
MQAAVDEPDPALFELDCLLLKEAWAEKSSDGLHHVRFFNPKMLDSIEECAVVLALRTIV